MSRRTETAGVYVRPKALDESSLPKPYVAGKPLWSELSQAAWKLAFRSIHHRDGLAAPDYIYNCAHPEMIWVWDSCFMALFTRYLPDVFPGIESLDNFYALQRDDGYISMTYRLADGKEAFGERINPPLFAWAEWEYARTTGRKDRIARVLPRLSKHFDWIFINRRQGQNLFYFEDAGSAGMDNSPRGRRFIEAGRHMGWVDLSSQLAHSALCISRLAEAVGDAGTASRARAQSGYVARSIPAFCWCPRSRFFHDRLDESNWLASKTAAGFWPMLAEIASPEQVQALCEHLEDPRTFGRPCPIPTLSYDDPNYTDNGHYWLGGVWAPTNYMVLTGLRANGRHDLARRLAVKYLDHMAETYTSFAERPRTLWEAYSPETPEPPFNNRTRGPERVRADFVGWTGLGPTAIFYECILGLEPDALTGTLTWNLGLTQEHGIGNYPLMGGRVDLHAEGRDSDSVPAALRVRSTVDFRLIVRTRSGQREFAIRRGKALSVKVS